jgi:hypothetical protein
MMACPLRRHAALRLRPALTALALTLICAFALVPHAAGAETRVSGGLEAVRIEAHDASLEEIFGALGAKFNLRYRTKVPLGRAVNGVYSGSLSRVLARLLDGYDHVVQRSPGGIEVTIIGLSQKSSTPGEAS